MDGILLNAKNTNGGGATATLVVQAMRAKKVFVFGELLSLPQVQSLRTSPDTAPTLVLLEIFAYGTYADYVKLAGTLPELNETQVFKLRQLTLVSLASKARTLAYSAIVRETQLKSVREVEDLLIECVYDGLIRARLDQQNQTCLIQWSASRDVKPETLDGMISKLNAWCGSADDALGRIDRAMSTAAQDRETESTQHKLVMWEAENIKTQVIRESESHLGEPTSKLTKTSGTSAASKIVSSVGQMLGRRG